MLVLSIISSIILFVACGSEHNDTAQMILGIFGGYVLLQGFVIFGILFGIGHILKNSENINDKLDKMMEIEMWKNGK